VSSPNSVDASVQRLQASDAPVGSAQSWLRARVRLESRVLVQAPPWVRGVFDHAWAPVQALGREVSCLPAALCDHLLGLDSGYVAIHAAASCYVPGPGVVRQRTVQNVAFVSIEDLALENERPLHVIGHLIDHHLGCGGEIESPWLTDGGGQSPQLKAAGARLPVLFALGYAVDSVAESDIRDYFAQSLALYCRDRSRLNVSDPQIYKWLRSTLWNRAFWKGRR
jgi:hypothetical protein